MKFIKDYQRFKQFRIDEALESGQFLVYHRTRLVEKVYTITDELDKDVNVFQQFAEEMIDSEIKKNPNTSEYKLALRNNLNLLSDMNPDVKLDDRGFPILKVGDKITTQDPRIISQGFRAGAGDFYGVGLYTCYDFDDQIRDFDNNGVPDMRGYGNNIVEFSVQNTGKFLILDMNESNNQAKKVWGPKHTLIDQLKKIMGGKFTNFYAKNRDLIDDFNEILLKTTNVAKDGKEYKLDKDKQGRFLTAPIGLNLAEMPGFISLVDGISFTGNNDGRVLVIYDADLAKPTRYTSDDGKTWQSMKKLEYQYERVEVGGKQILQCKVIDTDKELNQISIDRSASAKWLFSLDIPELLKDKSKFVKMFSEMTPSESDFSKSLDKVVDELCKSNKQLIDVILNRISELPITQLNLDPKKLSNYYSSLIYFLSRFRKNLNSEKDLFDNKINQILNQCLENIDVINLPISQVLYLSDKISEEYQPLILKLLEKSNDLYSTNQKFDEIEYESLIRSIEKDLPESIKEVVSTKIDEAFDNLYKELETRKDQFTYWVSGWPTTPLKRFIILFGYQLNKSENKNIDKFCSVFKNYIVERFPNTNPKLSAQIQQNNLLKKKVKSYFYDDFIFGNRQISNWMLPNIIKLSDSLSQESIDILSDFVISYLTVFEPESVGYSSKKGQNFIAESTQGTKLYDVLTEKMRKIKNNEKVTIFRQEETELKYQFLYDSISEYMKLELPLPELDYSEIADKIFKSMYGFGVKKDELLYQFGRLRNNTDFNKMKSAFGSRKGAIGKEYDLDYWIKDELKQKDLDKLNDLLKQKGINYQF
jgi:hypothetical protein